MSDYRLWVSDDRCTLVRLWPDGSLEFATRPAEGLTWGPPQLLAEEREAGGATEVCVVTEDGRQAVTIHLPLDPVIVGALLELTGQHGMKLEGTRRLPLLNLPTMED